MKHFRAVPSLCTLALMTATACLGADQPVNQLTDAEANAGWRLLFDGRTVNGWHGFKKPGFPDEAWAVEGQWLCCLGKGGNDIVSDGQFDEFDLTWEWKISPGGNSGLKYFVTDTRSSALGHEYQMYDDPATRTPGREPGKHDTASFYDVFKPAVRPPEKPPGQTNVSRVMVKGNHVEHWLNGVKVVEYDCGSEEVKAAVAASKFKSTPGFGTRLKGHILLQDHGGKAWLRNIKIRDLSAARN